jgi:outer membrane protein TolC
MAIGASELQVTGMGLPRDAFPEPTDQIIVPLDPDNLERVIDTALANRADFLGAKLRVNEQHALLGGARNRLRPQVDLVGSAGYTGIRQGGGLGNYFGPLFLSTAGPNATIGLQYQFPTQNRAARGIIVQTEAAVRQQNIQAANLARHIASSVVTAAHALNNTMLQLREAQQFSAAALAGRRGEADRLRQGVGSVLDVLQTEDRYISALLSEVNAHAAYATAIASFRLATGTYLDPRQPVQAVGREAFFSALKP